MVPVLGLAARFLLASRFGAAPSEGKVRPDDEQRVRFDEQFGQLPAQPDDMSRVSGVNSFAALPMFEGDFREEVAQQCGYRMPAAPDYEGGTNSGLWLAAADPGATVTAPGVAPSVAGKVIGGGRSEAQNNASLLGRVFVTRSSDCASNPSGAQELAQNARRSSERYALEAGFRLGSFRLAVPEARVSWFARDAPEAVSPLEWCLFSASSEFRLPEPQRLQPRRFAVRAPSPQTFRGTSEGGGFVYQFAARALALVALLVSVRLPRRRGAAIA